MCKDLFASSPLPPFFLSFPFPFLPRFCFYHTYEYLILSNFTIAYVMLVLFFLLVLCISQASWLRLLIICIKKGTFQPCGQILLPCLNYFGAWGYMFTKPFEAFYFSLILFKSFFSLLFLFVLFLLTYFQDFYFTAGSNLLIQSSVHFISNTIFFFFTRWIPLPFKSFIYLSSLFNFLFFQMYYFCNNLPALI